MSIVKAKTNPYGPATLDIQIEQGADFLLPFDLTRGDDPWDLDGCTLAAHFSTEWSPGGSCVELIVEVINPALGSGKIRFPAASSLNLSLPHPPKKTTNPTPFELGNWVFTVTDPSLTDEPTKRVAEGIVYLKRDPCRT